MESDASKTQSASSTSIDDINSSLIWNNFPDGLYLHPILENGEPGIFELVNDTACRALGYRREELLQMSPRELDDPDFSAEYIRTVMDKLSQEGQVIFEAVQRHKNGNIIPVEICAKQIQLHNKPYILSTARYLSHRMLATGTLAESNERLRTIMRKAHAGSWEWDVVTNENFWSEEIWHLYGLEPYSFEPSYEVWRQTIIREDREQTERIINHAAAHGQEFTIEWRVYDKQGKHRWLMSKGTPIMSENGTVCRYIGMVIDITEQKNIEEEKKGLERQILQSQKMELVGQLAGGIAHDFNNMLAIILGNAEIAQSQLKTTNELYDDIESIRKAATRSANLTRQLLAFAQKQNISPKILDINTVIDGMLSMLTPLIGENIALIWEPWPEKLSIKIDPSQLDQVLANLCVNARDAITDNGTITISTSLVHFDKAQYLEKHCCSHPGDYVLLTVVDSGEGISKRNLPHIFEPFFTTKSTDKGSGLGLSTVYGIVKQNSGFIECQSRIHQGSTFSIYFPLYTGNGTRHVDTEQHLGVSSAFPDAKTVILLVEDEPDILKFCMKLLESSGYEILTASSSADALKVAESFPGTIELLLTDVVLPDMNGCDLSNKIRSIRPSMKSVFMSGYSADILERHGRYDTTFNFIQKPFSAKELTAAIQETLCG